MPISKAVRNQAGLAIVAASTTLALAMTFLSPLEPWAQEAIWILLLGGVAYAATVFVTARSKIAPSSPEEQKLWAIRQAIASWLGERLRGEGGRAPSELTRILSDAVSEIDEQVIPTLRRLVERHQALAAHLYRYQAGDLPWPDLAVLERLRAIRSRQAAAINECIQQAANADATLVALLQESDEAKVATRAKKWADDLLTLYDSLAEVLRCEEDVERLTGLSVYPAPSQNGDGIGEPSSNLVRLVEDALRKLNKPSDLAACGLLNQLHLTIRSVHISNGGSNGAEGTALERAHALREAFVVSIGRLKPASGNSDGTTQALQYHILHEEYELEWPNSRIVTRHSISESTFHRLRRGAI